MNRSATAAAGLHEREMDAGLLSLPTLKADRGHNVFGFVSLRPAERGVVSDHVGIVFPPNAPNGVIWLESPSTTAAMFAGLAGGPKTSLRFSLSGALQMTLCFVFVIVVVIIRGNHHLHITARAFVLGHTPSAARMIARPPSRIVICLLIASDPA
jgi:hypothetical protein